MSGAVEAFLQSLDDDGQRFDRAALACQQAQRNLSPRGLENYLAGAQALSELAKGPDLVFGYLEQMPGVIREVGEDAIADVIESMMKLASLTSAAVLLLILGKLPMVATRLGDAELLRAYLKLLHQLAAGAPRGLRAMQEVIDELLLRLSLGGLRRWVHWGAQTYRQDFDGQSAYFALKSETARKMLERECRGLLFIDTQRKLNAYLRALWADGLTSRVGKSICPMPAIAFSISMRSTFIAPRLRMQRRIYYIPGWSWITRICHQPGNVLSSSLRMRASSFSLPKNSQVYANSGWDFFTSCASRLRLCRICIRCK